MPTGPVPAGPVLGPNTTQLEARNVCVKNTARTQPLGNEKQVVWSDGPKGGPGTRAASDDQDSDDCHASRQTEGSRRINRRQTPAMTSAPPTRETRK